MQRQWRVLCIIGALALGVVSPGLAASPQALLEALGVKTCKGTVQAPEFTLKDLQGQEVRLTDLRGKVILLNFWATWCLPCQWEMPEMDKLYQTFKDQGFMVLAVALDAEGAQTVAPFVTARQLTYPVLLDTELKAARQYRLPGPPSTFLIDRQGALIGIALGPREWAGEPAKALVAALLEAPRKVRTSALGCSWPREVGDATAYC